MWRLCRGTKIICRLLPVFILAWPGAAKALIDLEEIRPGLYVSPGFVVAASIVADGTTKVLPGGELSVFWLEYTASSSIPYSVGGFVDAGYSYATQLVHLVLGVQAGLGALGADAGYVVALDATSRFHGAAFSLWVPLAFVVPYARASWFVGCSDEYEVGVMLKLPLRVLTED